MDRKINDLNTRLTDLRAQLRLLDMNNAEDLQELFDTVEQIKTRFNDQSETGNSHNEYPVPPCWQQNPIEAPPGAAPFTVCCA
jgi:hypothetical protein